MANTFIKVALDSEINPWLRFTLPPCLQDYVPFPESYSTFSRVSSLTIFCLFFLVEGKSSLQFVFPKPLIFALTYVHVECLLKPLLKLTATYKMLFSAVSPNSSDW